MQALFEGVPAKARTLLLLSAGRSGWLLGLRVQHYTKAGLLALWKCIAFSCPGALLEPRLRLLPRLRRRWLSRVALAEWKGSSGGL